jgi:prolyl-tRNA synthetase
MRQSQLFTKTRREAPKDEVSKNAQLLIRGGYIHKEMAGVYSYLPLGRRVLERIERIVREEMDAIGGQEIRMATLHPSEPWKQTGAWDKVDVVFKILSRTEKGGYLPIHEVKYKDILLFQLIYYNLY